MRVISVILAAFAALAVADYECPEDRPVLLCNCRLTTSTESIDSGNMSLCDYQYGQVDCESHRTKNYCCYSVYQTQYPGRFNGVNCTGAKKYLDA